ncbi:MAG: sodium ion-translocating decarboxylase subunit beta, partial [Gammaproteobacteria bacterium]|nr:sodium ion-translocating decarboxylase subunit beta [Gammaproteobacteria bacterium]
MKTLHKRTFFLFLITFLSLAYTVNAQEYSKTSKNLITVTVPSDATLLNVSIKNGAMLKIGDKVREGDFIALILDKDHNKITVTSGASGEVTYINDDLYTKYTHIPAGTTILKIKKQDIVVQSTESTGDIGKLSFTTVFKNLIKSTGLYALIFDNAVNWTEGIGKLLMISVGLLLIYLGISKGFEPLLLIPIGMGAVLSNIPLAFINDEGGIIRYVYDSGIKTGIFPLIIFMGVGAMTDFGPLLANPRTTLLGAAAQFGIFTTLIGAIILTKFVPGIDFSLKDASSIAIIGGAD